MSIFLQIICNRTFENNINLRIHCLSLREILLSLRLFWKINSKNYIVIILSIFEFFNFINSFYFLYFKIRAQSF